MQYQRLERVKWSRVATLLHAGCSHSKLNIIRGRDSAIRRVIFLVFQRHVTSMCMLGVCVCGISGGMCPQTGISRHRHL
jgi:hypothetical protein